MQTSQYIFNETPKANFGIHDKAFLDREDISGLAKIALLYLLGKPKHWRLRITDIKKKLGCGTSKAYKVLAELRAKGFAVMVRGQQKVEWFFYSKPKPQPSETRANSQSVKVQRVEVCDDLDSIEKPERIEKPQQHAPEPGPITAPATPIVVVQGSINEKEPHQTHTDNPYSGLGQREVGAGIALNQSDCPNVAVDTDGIGIDSIPGIDKRHKKVARKALEQLTKAEADAVVTALTLALSKGTVSNPIGYLLQLVKASKNGTFSPVQPSGAAPAPTLAERIAKDRAKEREAATRGKMSNAEWFEMMKAKFGDRIKAPNLEGGLKRL